jgi:hypothetical protein
VRLGFKELVLRNTLLRFDAVSPQTMRQLDANVELQ